MYDSSNEKQLRILKSVCSYLSLFPGDEYISNIWGSAISNKELCERFDEISQQFNDGEDQTDLINSLKELECKFFHHEFIKRFILFHVNLSTKEDVDFLKFKKFIQKLLNIGILSKSQFDVGVKNAQQEIKIKSEEDKKQKDCLETLMNEHLSSIKFKDE